MIREAKAIAFCVNPNSPDFKKQVAVTVHDDGGYTTKVQGTYRITFAVQDAPGVTTTITANITGGQIPVLTVPKVRKVPQGAGFNYMTGIKATDAEDGDITAKVIHNTPVKTNSIGGYKVTYSVTDSDGNTVTKNGIVLVGGGWTVKNGYALYAQDFARKLSAVAGTGSEAKRLAKAMAIRISKASDANFGEYIPVVIANSGGYKKAAGTYNIKFAVSERRSVTKTIKASISDDRPRTPPATPAPRVIVNNPTPPAPPAPEPVIEVPTPEPPPQIVTEVEGPIRPIEVPTATPEPAAGGKWHLIDLLLAIVTVAIGFYLMIYVMRRREEDEDDGVEERRVRAWSQLTAMLGIGSVIALLITQDFSGDMHIADIWTALFAVISGISAISLISVTSVGGEAENEA
jgi:hypothetical protein